MNVALTDLSKAREHAYSLPIDEVDPAKPEYFEANKRRTATRETSRA